MGRIQPLCLAQLLNGGGDQTLPLTPLGQSQVLPNAARLDQGPLSLAGLFQRLAPKLHVARFDLDPTALHRHVVAIAGQGNLASQHVAVSEDKYPL